MWPVGFITGSKYFKVKGFCFVFVFFSLSSIAVLASLYHLALLPFQES